MIGSAWLAASVSKRGLGGTAVVIFVAALIAYAVGSVVWSNAKASWYEWRADSAEKRAYKAEDKAATAQTNANSANAGAANAATTRDNIDAGTLTVRVETEQAAQRIESHADRPAPVADLDPVDPDVLRELAAAEGRTRAAADRLQRARPR